jgi:hypothetical protein
VTNIVEPQSRTGARHEGVLVRITSPHFVAGAIFKNKRCVHAAPIIRWMVGMGSRAAHDSLVKKGWKWEVVPNQADES